MKLIVFIFFIGVFLRIININQSLWLDEAISVLASRDFTYSGIIFDFLKIDNHPPLFYLLLRFWGQVFGFVDFNLRFLPVLIGSVLIFFVYKIVFILSKDTKTALTALFLAAFSPLLIYYSQELRMYILITLLCAIQIFVFQSILKKESNLKWILLSILNCLLFFTDYITVFFFPVIILYPVITQNLKLLKRIFLSFIPLSILFILWYPYFNAQLVMNRYLVDVFPGWEYVVGGATFKNLTVLWMKFVLGRISFEPKIAYYGLVGVFSLPILFALYLASENFKKNLLFWVWLIVPVALGFLFSFVIPVFNYFRFIFVYPAFLILIASGISHIKGKLKYLVISLIITGNILGLLIYYIDPSSQRENWKQAISFIEQNAKPDELVVFEFHEPFAPYRFYSSRKVDAVGATDSYFANKIKTDEKLESYLAGKTGVYHFEYLRDLSDPQKYVEQKLQEEGFRKGEIFDSFKNIGHISKWSR